MHMRRERETCVDVAAGPPFLWSCDAYGNDGTVVLGQGLIPWVLRFAAQQRDQVRCGWRPPILDSDSPAGCATESAFAPGQACIRSGRAHGTDARRSGMIRRVGMHRFLSPLDSGRGLPDTYRQPSPRCYARLEEHRSFDSRRRTIQRLGESTDQIRRSQ